MEYLNFDDFVRLVGDILFHLFDSNNADFIHEVHFPEFVVVVDMLVVVLALIGHVHVMFAFVIFFVLFEVRNTLDDDSFDFGDTIVELGLFLVGGVTFGV